MKKLFITLSFIIIGICSLHAVDLSGTGSEYNYFSGNTFGGKSYIVVISAPLIYDM